MYNILTSCKHNYWICRQDARQPHVEHRIKDCGPKIERPGPRIEDQGARKGLRTEDQGKLIESKPWMTKHIHYNELRYIKVYESLLVA